MARTSAVLRAALVAVAVALVCGSVASALPVIALASSAVASPVAAPREASLATFTGYWWGHTRSLRITPNGRGVEAISSGCCLRVINLHFRLSRASGTSQNATAVATVTAVWIPHPIGFDKKNPPPRVGERRTLRLQGGVITDYLTGANYCAPKVDKCGL